MGKGRARRTVQTGSGTRVTLDRDYGRCPRCGAGVFPLDAELGLRPSEPWTDRARERIVRLGTELPFGRGAALLTALTGIQCGESTMRRMTEAAGAELMAAERAAPPTPAPVWADRQQISVDGAMVPLVGGVWREVRTVVIGELATGADGEPATRALSYFSRMTDAATFADAALGEVLRRGTDQATTVAAVADGAPWCQEFFAYHVPQAVRILDFPHAVEHLSAVAQAVFGRGTTATSDWLGQQCHALRTGVADDVLRAIAALPVTAAAHPEDAIPLRDRTVAYFQTRRAQIAYARFTAAGLPIGSGAVESANKLVVEARLKGAGMHWQPAHIDAMLALRCALCSDRWATCWRQLTDHRPASPARTSPAPPPRATPFPSPPSSAVLPPRTPRTPTIAAGKPTNEHSWKQGLNRRTPRPHHDDCQ